MPQPFHFVSGLPLFGLSMLAASRYLHLHAEISSTVVTSETDARLSDIVKDQHVTN